MVVNIHSDRCFGGEHSLRQVCMVVNIHYDVYCCEHLFIHELF